MLTISAVRDLYKTCREEVKAVITEKYSLYDRIWTDRIRITPAIFDHGEDTVKEINAVMPNLLTYQHPELRTIDEAANDYGFESTSDLIEYLLAYVPKKGLEEKMCDQLFDSRLREMVAAESITETIAPDSPF
ncbi:hypothetical protein [Mailhella massiliensis]|uniref:hypothetical protein n=1 Tax=Mailhella massiliensis TaxID=1903261 RepID=UPI00097DA8CB|nr:hypothetical protein [Mailhella massiliensis]